LERDGIGGGPEIENASLLGAKLQLAMLKVAPLAADTRRLEKRPQLLRAPSEFCWHSRNLRSCLATTA
jgi:hypothetical protein